jgi:S1-C subfamily serine protease
VFVRSCADAPVRGGRDTVKSAACAAGVEPGDVITSIDGKGVDRVSALQRAVRAHKPGDQVAVKLMREGKEQSLRVKLNAVDPDDERVADAGAPTRQDDDASSKLGIEVQPLTEQFISANKVESQYRGLEVTGIDPAGPAAGKFSQGDLITGVRPARTRIRTTADLEKALAGKKAGDVLSLEVYNLPTKQLNIVNITIGG